MRLKFWDDTFLGLKKSFASLGFFRRVLFPIARQLDFRFTWKHDITGRPFSLLTWSHKGYWFYGADREKDEIDGFRRHIAEGDRVLEIGGHIGYVTQVFEDLVGENGQVCVVEPTLQSRLFLERNVGKKTRVLPYAVSNASGTVTLYTERFGGFTNSIVREFIEESVTTLNESQSANRHDIEGVRVEAITLDALCEGQDFQPDFLKIDIEGAELLALQGGSKMLGKLKAAMIEISRDAEETMALMQGLGFAAYRPDGSALKPGETVLGNVFFVRETLIRTQ
ncbi:hypothetical protein GCM10011316_35300 [Roseibium aquae]|uniref:Methyltransferase FkbM domain-containing protein n=1 Tax=Roseibium aquae TaxID=1323746 RepID=A0A916TN78_9HYPH|nr:FkbM family methyltransferase [Roseibium aquae]GGB60208.1 hypothetical protein GCM10011316_35300 [Roseibium aquae]